MSDCACVYGGDGEEARFDVTTHPKARQPHKCGECKRVILAGETYERTAGNWDGAMQVHKTCQECQEIRAALFCDGWTFGVVWDHIEEHWLAGGNILGCIDALETVAAKEKLSTRWRAYREIPS